MNKISIIGKKVVAIRGYNHKWNDRRVKYPKVEPEFILFDDKETFIQLEEQDYYSYHDCSSAARHIYVKKDKDRWHRIMNDLVYADATEEIPEW